MPKIAFTLINLAALTLISFFCVDIFYSVITGDLRNVDNQKIVAEHVPKIKKQVRITVNRYQGISDRALFGTLEKSNEQEKVDEIETLEPTSLNLALLGTVEGDGKNGWAIIVDTAKRKQDIYHVGDSVQEAVIKKIIRNKVVLRVRGQDEVLTIEEGSRKTRAQAFSRNSISPTRPPVRRLSRTITLRRSDLEESLQDVNQILSEARIRPHFNSDRVPDGLIVTGIRGNSIFRRMGLRNGDIVQGVDGNPISNPDDIISMYNNLKSASDVAIQILRRGREQTINYRFR
jgi:general secretion pathway protein C